MGCAESQPEADVIGNELIPGGRIEKGGKIMANGFMFAVQDDGNLVVYQDGGEPLWASDTCGIDARELIMQEDGNLVLYANDGSAAWASGTDGRGKNNRVAMQDDGNLVMYNQSNKPIWCTRTENGRSPHWPTGEVLEINRMDADETMWENNALDAQGYFFKVQDDGNLVVYKDGGEPLWASNTNGQGQGPYRAVMQGDGNFVLYDSNDEALWASNTMDKGGVCVKMQDDGNFVMYTGDDSPVWCTRTDGGQTSPAFGEGEMC
jgi:hypothetical protein